MNLPSFSDVQNLRRLTNKSGYFPAHPDIQLTEFINTALFNHSAENHKLTIKMY
jgi:hypothetical protein